MYMYLVPYNNTDESSDNSCSESDLMECVPSNQDKGIHILSIHKVKKVVIENYNTWLVDYYCRRHKWH